MLEKNLKLLAKKSPSLYQRILEYHNQENSLSKKFSVKKGKKGYHYLQENYNEKIRIHSSYDPMNESKAFLEKYKEEIEAHDFILFFGAGLGYPIEVLKKMYPKKTVYLYEPSIEIFNYLLNQFDLQKINAYMVGDLYGDIQNILKRDLFVLVLPIYQQYFQKEYEQFLQQYKKPL